MNDEQIKLLEQEPPKDALSTRQQAGITLTYIEGWYAIQKANEIFGAGGWSREIVYLKEVNREQKEIPQRNNNPTKTRYDVSYTCECRVIVNDCSSSDVGYGIGQSYQGYGDAVESATKEAVTDALKRCLRSFGNAFGNCLYDKQWLSGNGHKGEPAPKPAPPKTDHRESFRRAMREKANGEGTNLDDFNPDEKKIILGGLVEFLAKGATPLYGPYSDTMLPDNVKWAKLEQVMMDPLAKWKLTDKCVEILANEREKVK